MNTFEVSWLNDDGLPERVAFDDADDARHFAAALGRRGFWARVREYAPAPEAWNVQGVGA